MLKALTKIIKKDQIPLFLKNHGMNNNICEIGVRRGRNFKKLLTCEPKLAVAIDHWKADVPLPMNDMSFTQDQYDDDYKFVCDNFKPPQCLIIKENTNEAVKRFKNEFFDYIYIDADHSFYGAYKDITDWWPKIRNGGVLAGHDYLNGCINGVEFGVKSAISLFINKYNIKNIHITKDKKFPSWIIFKNK
jgi:hypothetical protein